MDVSLWAARIERPLTAPEAEALAALLPPERRERLLRLRKPEKRQEALCAYGLLHLALQKSQGWIALPPMAYGPQGKPRFPDHPEVHFSLSHTDGAVLAGVGEEPLGVDIEKLRPVRVETLRRMAGEAGETAFFQSWVRREALGKRRGTGVGALLSAQPALLPGETVCLLDVFPGYAAAVATGGQTVGPVERLSLEALLSALEI